MFKLQLNFAIFAYNLFLERSIFGSVGAATKKYSCNIDIYLRTISKSEKIIEGKQVILQQ